MDISEMDEDGFPWERLKEVIWHWWVIL